jgi:hypothetical protein
MFIENDVVSYGVRVPRIRYRWRVSLDSKWILGTLTTLRGFATRTTRKRRRVAKPSRSVKKNFTCVHSNLGVGVRGGGGIM